ncbi:MAG: two-component system response regulator, partial [Massilia sp.]|nr:two-component system response regulator [Massilia sp.]
MSTTSNRPLILAVDDEASNLQLLRQILQDHYRLLFAKDGARALELAHKEHPDLILLDVMMPGMSGYEVCAALKANPATAPIPVIFVTALNDTADELEGFEAGAVDYITKPVSPPVVRARVRTHLSLVRMDELKASRLAIVQRLGLAA